MIGIFIFLKGVFIIHIDMDEYFRMVIDLYKTSFKNYLTANQSDTVEIDEAIKRLNSAIDDAKVRNLSPGVFESLKNDVECLKYEIMPYE